MKVVIHKVLVYFSISHLTHNSKLRVTGRSLSQSNNLNLDLSQNCRDPSLLSLKSIILNRSLRWFFLQKSEGISDCLEKQWKYSGRRIYQYKLRRHSEILIYINRFPFTLIPFFNIYSYNLCHKTTGVILLKERGVKGDDYVYDIFLIVFVQCIDIYADHCS